MSTVTLDIPDHMRGVIMMGLCNADAALRQSLEKAKTETVTPSTADEMARWTGMIVWIEQAVERLR
jgi:hypothetical protein